MSVQAVIPDPVTNLATYATAAGAVALLGAVKKYTTLADTRVGKVLKPVQPWVVLGLALLGPHVFGAHAPDPAQFAAAPTATLLAVGAAEIFRRLNPQKP